MQITAQNLPVSAHGAVQAAISQGKAGRWRQIRAVGVAQVNFVAAHQRLSKQATAADFSQLLVGRQRGVGVQPAQAGADARRASWPSGSATLRPSIW